MPIRCPHCGTKHDVTEFEADQSIHCHCGFKLDLSLINSPEDLLRYCESEDERIRVREIQRDAQTICGMILNEDCPGVDVEIAKDNLRQKVRELFPDKMDVYEMIYEARFRRLWEQFRGSGPGSG